MTPESSDANVFQVYEVTGEIVSIRFVNFWASFNKDNNFFVDLLESEGFQVIVVHSQTQVVDLEIVSVFPKKLNGLLLKGGRKLFGLGNNPTFKNRLDLAGIPERRNRSRRRIWYTGENLRVPFDADFDGYLSFDASDEVLNNAYLPLWMLSVGWFSNSYNLERIGVSTHVKELLAGRKLLKPKSKMICAFVGNPEPIRLRTIREFNETFQVDVFGSYYGNFVASKIEVAPNYRFSIAFENDLYPGYVTEKLVESYLSGNVPIYRGLFDSQSEVKFNTKAFINFNDFKNTGEICSYIASISDNRYEEIYCQPLMLELPKVNVIKKVLLG
ncbi:Glycosyl transferase family 10 [Candidatus Nanopelagicaceae bacterium]